MMLGLPVCRACRSSLGAGQGARKTPLGWVCAACAWLLDHTEDDC